MRKFWIALVLLAGIAIPGVILGVAFGQTAGIWTSVGIFVLCLIYDTVIYLLTHKGMVQGGGWGGSVTGLKYKYPLARMLGDD
jgi:hypothetical protein